MATDITITCCQWQQLLVINKTQDRSCQW